MENIIAGCHCRHDGKFWRGEVTLVCDPCKKITVAFKGVAVAETREDFAAALDAIKADCLAVGLQPGMGLD